MSQGGNRRIFSEVKHLKTTAVAIAIRINSEESQNEFLPKLQAELRGVDEILIVSGGSDGHVFLLLLPYANEHGANELLKRIDLSEVSAETAGNGSNGKTFGFSKRDISVCMWMLEVKTSPEKVLLEIDQFCNRRHIDVIPAAKSHASISSFA